MRAIEWKTISNTTLPSAIELSARIFKQKSPSGFGFLSHEWNMPLVYPTPANGSMETVFVARISQQHLV